ncbi:uncharacterized protein LOC124640153 isoform X1 [Helicoverpa zea]|uniref:uncharacterized protein LOC124640153 isoform X1 n=1 Tax=Helicoverpa zea TaxID=7113 RepID=UPI001F5800F4|nr:uncharacterized protein LOC124640153 isoform X1 [Helicoverpa zea]
MSLSFTLFGLHTSCRKSRISVHLVNIVTIVESGWSEGLFVKMVCSILVVTCNFCNGKIFARDGKQKQMCSRCVECDNIILDNFNYCECCGCKMKNNTYYRIEMSITKS